MNFQQFMECARAYEYLGGAVREQLEDILAVNPELIGAPPTVAERLGLTLDELEEDVILPVGKELLADQACEFWNTLGNCNINALGMIHHFLEKLPEMRISPPSIANAVAIEVVTSATLAEAIKEYIEESGSLRVTTDGRVVNQ